MKINGSKVLITGGARGLGRFLVEAFIQHGATVGVFERDDESCSLLQRDFPDQVSTWRCDVSDHQQVDVAVRTAEKTGFYPDVLINNAGIIHSEPLINLFSKQDRVHSRENWRKVISTDLDSVFYVTSRVVEGMVERRCKGVVISISSISAQGNAGQSAYSAAKAGVNALTKTWCRELGPFGIRFVSVAPGFLDTPSTRASLSDSYISRIEQKIPLRKLGSPQCIYQSVCSILENDYINGTILEVDGGFSL